MGNGTSAPVVPPYQGLNDQVPSIALKFPYCTLIKNFNNFYGSLNLRQGNLTFARVTTAGVFGLNIVGYDSTTPSLFIMVADHSNMKWYEVSTGTPNLVFTETSFSAGAEVYTLFFNNYLFYFGTLNLNPNTSPGPIQYNGTSWGVAGYTWPSGFNPFGGNVFKNRAYFIDQSSAAYCYTNLFSIAGPTYRVDLSTVIGSRANLYIIRSISTNENQNPDSVQAFIFSNGQVFVFAGSYPDDSTWGEVSNFKISNPLYHNSYVDAKGDSFIFTYSEILSLRNLFTSGYSEESETGIGSTIKNRYRQIIKGLGTSIIYVKGIYDQLNDRIIISFPVYVNPATGVSVSGVASQLIYDFTLSGWYEYVSLGYPSSGVSAIAYFNNQTYICTTSPVNQYASVILLEGNTNYLDQALDAPGTGNDKGIDFELITAPLPIQKVGTTAITGTEVILKTDLYPEISFQYIADLGRETSGFQVLTDQGPSVAKPLVNVGINDAIVTQLHIIGTTVAASIGLSLYAFNIWYNTGDKGSR